MNESYLTRLGELIKERSRLMPQENASADSDSAAFSKVVREIEEMIKLGGSHQTSQCIESVLLIFLLF